MTHGLEPTRLLCTWDSPGKNTGVGCHFLFSTCPQTHPHLLYPLCPEPPGGGGDSGQVGRMEGVGVSLCRVLSGWLCLPEGPCSIQPLSLGTSLVGVTIAWLLPAPAHCLVPCGPTTPHPHSCQSFLCEPTSTLPDLTLAFDSAGTLEFSVSLDTNPESSVVCSWQREKLNCRAVSPGVWLTLWES